MLYVPFTVGTLVGSTSSFSPLQICLLLMSVTFAFIARQSFLEWWISRSRGTRGAPARLMMLVYVSLALLIGAPVVFFYHRVWLVPVAILTALLLTFNGSQAVRHKDRTVIGETIAILGLTMTAPTAYYVCRGEWDSSAWLLWSLCILYFASSVFYVKLRVHSLNRRREGLRKQSSGHCALYHLFLIAALVVLAVTGSTNLFVLVAFTPVLARAFSELVNPARRTSLKQIGVLEIVYSVFFLAFVTIGFRGL
jgi:YwiC-like protein